MNASSPAANLANAMSETCAHISGLPRRLIGSAAKPSAPNGNTTSSLFETMKKPIQMPVGNGALKSAERIAVEAELAKHSAQGLTLTPQRLAGLTGADIALVRKILANMLRYGVTINVGTQKAPAYRLTDKDSAPDSVSLAHVRHTANGSTYTGAELRPYEGRPGAMDAFKLPSVVGGKQVEPRRPAAMCASSVPEKAGWPGR